MLMRLDKFVGTSNLSSWRRLCHWHPLGFDLRTLCRVHKILGTPERAQAEVLAADEARHQALYRHDTSKLAWLVADELSYVHSSGYAEGKDLYIDRVRRARVRYEEAQRDPVNVRIYGEVAIIDGRIIQTGTSENGMSFRVDALFLSVWIKRDGRWQMSAWTSTPTRKTI